MNFLCCVLACVAASWSHAAPTVKAETKADKERLQPERIRADLRADQTEQAKKIQPERMRVPRPIPLTPGVKPRRIPTR